RGRSLERLPAALARRGYAIGEAALGEEFLRVVELHHAELAAAEGTHGIRLPDVEHVERDRVGRGPGGGARGEGARDPAFREQVAVRAGEGDLDVAVMLLRDVGIAD